MTTSAVKVFGFLVRSILMGMIAALFLFQFFPELLKPITDPEPAVEPKPEISSYADTISKASDSIVNIRTFNLDRQRLYPYRPQLRVSGGSGVIISDLGYIVTNYHVIAKAGELTIELKDGRTAIPQVIAYDEATDLAVLKINLDNLPYMIMNSSISSRMGDLVFAIGYPFGVGQVTTMGIVSSTGTQVRIAEYEDYVIADAQTFPGNSGGALINSNGDLLGIVTSQASTAVTFAISTRLAMDVVEQLVNQGRVIRGWLGFSGGPLDRERREKYGESSYIVNGITPDGPAAKAGLLNNDIVVALDGMSAQTAIDLHRLIASYKPGTQVSLDIVRNDVKMTLTLTVEERPESQNKSLDTLNR